MSQANTLFKYFSKSPVPNGVQSSVKKRTPALQKSAEKCNGKQKRTPALCSDEDEDSELRSGSIEEPSPVKKRRRILTVESEDSDDDYSPGKHDDDSESGGSEELSNQGSEPESLEEDVSPEPKKRKKKARIPFTKKRSLAEPLTAKTNGSSPSSRSIIVTTPPRLMTTSSSSTPISETKSKLALFAAKETLSEKKSSSDSVANEKMWAHLAYPFLRDDRITDHNRKRPDHPEYNPRTLYVPEDFMRNLTPAMRQWWEIKCQHFDSVLFFKVGKFYELYHMDAVTGVNELNLSYMKGDFAHSGFPEIAYSRFAPMLVEKGYKVARVEQTETPSMMEERCKTLSRPSKFDRVVKRELCQVTTKGTRTFNISDGDACGDSGSHFLLSLTEKSLASGSVSYGVCFVDTTIGVFYIGQFEDDRHCSRLRTMLAHYVPVQILYERGVLSQRTELLLSSSSCPVPPSLRSGLFSGSEFWGAQKTLSHLMSGKYFVTEKDKTSGLDYWPTAVRKFVSEDDPLGITPRNDGELALRCLGAITWYLQVCCLDQQLLSMQMLEVFTPVDCGDNMSKIEEVQSAKIHGRYMVLDGITIENLDLLSDSECSLITKLNNCCTAFGERFLRRWISAPLCDLKAISARQEAITWLLSCNGQEIAKEVKVKLAGLPDLERMLSAIHSQGNEAKSKMHPDSRAIFYEDKIYSKRRINDFLAALTGFKDVVEVAEIFEGTDCKSNLLLQITHNKETSPVGCFPDLKHLLKFFDEAFNHEVAKKEGRIIPIKGVDLEYDGALEDIAQVQKKLDVHLKEQRELFGCKVAYFGTERKRYQIEVPDSACKCATNDHALQSQRKGFKRYYTSEGKKLLEEMMIAEDRKVAAIRDLSRKIFAQFSSFNDKWVAAVECISILDVLLCLAEHANCQEGGTCIPKFTEVSINQKPFISIKKGRHPCILVNSGFIPNDVFIGPIPGENFRDEESKDNNNVILVTGPNMGGKSTLMRQVGLIIIMAQMGCHVPAESCILTPADRIFTRLGASDRIGDGESTFCVEMSETAAILRHATEHSIVLMDELGRGTATYDGTAIAASVVKELATLGCRSLFSTHYHGLVTEFGKWPGVALGHMACMVETDDLDEECDERGQERVTFLYQFTPGACPKSHGFHAARLAGVPKSVVRSAWKAAKEMETKANMRKAFKALLSLNESVNGFGEELVKALSLC